MSKDIREISGYVLLIWGVILLVGNLLIISYLFFGVQAPLIVKKSVQFLFFHVIGDHYYRPDYWDRIQASPLYLNLFRSANGLVFGSIMIASGIHHIRASRQKK